MQNVCEIHKINVLTIAFMMVKHLSEQSSKRTKKIQVLKFKDVP